MTQRRCISEGMTSSSDRIASTLMNGAMTATFYTGLGCLLGPSVIFVSIRAIMG